jgi:glutathione S-transferase
MDFCCLNTVEPPILGLQTTKFLEGDKGWYTQRVPVVEDRVRYRLGELSGRLGDADWLDHAFSAGDLMMVSVLVRLKASGIIDEYPNLSAYVARGEGRPAYKVRSLLKGGLSPPSHREADKDLAQGCPRNLASSR